MKLGRLLIALVVALPLTISGCGGDEKVDTSKLEKSFSTAQPSTKSAVDSAVAAIKSKDYAKAGAALQMLAAKSGLTPDQKAAIQDVSKQLTQRIEQQAKETAKQGEKALGDLKKQLSK